MPLEWLVAVELLLEHENWLVFDAQFAVVALVLLDKVLSECFYARKFTGYRVPISLAFIFTDEAVKPNLPLDLTFQSR